MKITKVEKVVLGVLVFLVLFMVGTISYTANMISEAGGVKSLIIDVGKEIKDIGEEIAKD